MVDVLKDYYLEKHLVFVFSMDHQGHVTDIALALMYNLHCIIPLQEREQNVGNLG